MIKPIAIALTLASALLAALLYVPRSTRDHFQGWVEADLLFIGPDAPGRLSTLPIREGDDITAGALLFTMESDVQQADQAAAAAAVSQAEAALKRVEAAQQRPPEIDILRAREAKVLANIAASANALKRAQTLLEKGIATYARLDQARAVHQANEASLAEIRQQIAVAGMAARVEDIEATKQQLNQARARLKAATTRLEQRRVESPAAARVQAIYYRPGEIVPPARPIASLLPPERLKIRFFVPQARLADINIGQALRITCDGCADMRTARVSFIAAEAEFTPPVIYSREERAKLVFRIEATPDRPGRFRAGQPVTIALAPSDD